MTTAWPMIDSGRDGRKPSSEKNIRVGEAVGQGRQDQRSKKAVLDKARPAAALPGETDGGGDAEEGDDQRRRQGDGPSSTT
jgi:hypothetical protein